MPSTLIRNIKTLINTREDTHLLRGKEMADLPCISDAYLILEDEEIASYGEMKDLDSNHRVWTNEADASGRLVLCKKKVVF